jgi:hypothetical protein
MTDGAPHNLTTAELLALLRDASLKPESIADEISCAGAKPCTAAQIAEARELLSLLQQERTAQSVGLPAEGAAAEPLLARRASALPEPLALAVVRAAGEAQRQEALVALASAAEKSVAKEAKRELQRLKQRGIQVQELKPRGDSVLKPLPETEAPACYASSIDAYGERAVWWSRATRGGIEVVQAVISDVRGILAIDALAMSRRNFRDFAKRLPREGGVVTSVEVPKEHARWLIASAAEEGARNGFSPPPAYADALRILGPAPQQPAPPLSASIEFGPEGELPYRLAGPSLFSDPLLSTWIPEEDVLRSFVLKVDEIAVSRLYLDDAQRKAAFERTADDAAAAYFTPQRRTRYARRLLEMAHVLASENRLDAARTAVAVAHDLESEEGARNPFCRALLTHALEGRWKQPAEAASAPMTPSGLITP